MRLSHKEHRIKRKKGRKNNFITTGRRWEQANLENCRGKNRESQKKKIKREKESKMGANGEVLSSQEKEKNNYLRKY